MSDTSILPAPTQGQANAVVAPIETGNPLVAYSSIQTTDTDSKLAMLDAITNATPISGHLGEIIRVQHLIIMNTTVTDAATGEVTEVQRTVLVTDDGTAYSATSGGIIRSLTTMIAVMGEPVTWTAPVEMVVIEEGQKGRKYYTAKYGRSLEGFRKS